MTPAAYAHMTAMLQTLAEGRIVVALEGGYNLCSIAASAKAVVGSLLGDPVPKLYANQAPRSSAVRDIDSVVLQHRKFWRCLRHFGYDSTTADLEANRKRELIAHSRNSAGDSSDSESAAEPPNVDWESAAEFDSSEEKSLPAPELWRGKVTRKRHQWRFRPYSVGRKTWGVPGQKKVVAV